jgi:hypothetical protein
MLILHCWWIAFFQIVRQRTQDEKEAVAHS